MSTRRTGKLPVVNYTRTTELGYTALQDTENQEVNAVLHQVADAVSYTYYAALGNYQGRGNAEEDALYAASHLEEAARQLRAAAVRLRPE